MRYYGEGLTLRNATLDPSLPLIAFISLKALCLSTGLEKAGYYVSVVL